MSVDEKIFNPESGGRTPASGLAGLLRPAATSVDEMSFDASSCVKTPASGLTGSLRPTALKKEASEQEAAQYVLHEKCERYHFGNDSEGENTAEQKELAKQGRDVAKPKHYRVRTRSKPERLLTGRKE